MCKLDEINKAIITLQHPSLLSSEVSVERELHSGTGHNYVDDMKSGRGHMLLLMYDDGMLLLMLDVD
jgi:hypothetical protein